MKAWEVNEQKSAGLYKKYIVKRTDGGHRKGRKHEDCAYFVLDTVHDEFARAALLAYANACQRSHPDLARDILNSLPKQSTKDKNED